MTESYRCDRGLPLWQRVTFVAKSHICGRVTLVVRVNCVIVAATSYIDVSTLTLKDNIDFMMHLVVSVWAVFLAGWGSASQQWWRPLTPEALSTRLKEGETGGINTARRNACYFSSGSLVILIRALYWAAVLSHVLNDYHNACFLSIAVHFIPDHLLTTNEIKQQDSPLYSYSSCYTHTAPPLPAPSRWVVHFIPHHLLTTNEIKQVSFNNEVVVRVKIQAVWYGCSW